MAIICIVGLIGSGKDIAADYLKKQYNFKKIDMGTVLKEMLWERNISPTRKNLQKFRVEHGNEFLAREIVRRISEKPEKIVVSGIRKLEDYKIIKKQLKNVKLIQLDANKKIRFQRLRQRRLEKDPATIEDFEQQENREFELFDFQKLFAIADYKIENNTTIENLNQQLDKILGDIS